MGLRIEDYGIIGDTHTAGLVGCDGSIDWLCLPRFDSDACFAQLLGTPEHGYWRIAPATGDYEVRRAYRPDSLVLETEFETADGVARLVDCMPIREHHPQVVRMVQSVRGSVAMRMDLVIRFGNGSMVPWVRRVDGLLAAVSGPDALALWTPVRTRGEDMTTAAEFTVAGDDHVPFVLTWYPSQEAPPRPVDAHYAITDTEMWWRDWAAMCSYEGVFREPVVRSLITLKALTYHPTGGIVAAPTTSLPETLGGERNWDYRYCWLRDATLTLQALMRGGYHDEALDWRDWLLRAVAGDVSKLQIMYGPGGERRLDEWVVDWLPGYEGSAPVRIGNAASGQFQLDVYGEVLSALYEACAVGSPLSASAWDLQVALVEFVENNWQEPDEGIWEVRGPRRHFTHSKVMAWVAVDRAVRSIEELGLDGPLDRWRQVRDAIHEEVCAQGYNAAVGSFTQYFGSDALDASLLMIPLVGFLPATDDRVRSTVEAIERGLTEDGFVLRYRTGDAGDVDGLHGREGAFLACSFWMADCLHLIGRPEDARAMLERLLGLRNELGLLAEEYDVHAGRQVGNFPQAFSHVSLVNAAFNLTGHPRMHEQDAAPAVRRSHLHGGRKRWAAGPEHGGRQRPGRAGRPPERS
ncbi:MAG TPA: glycoside hydrolase family 15 protein [Acidimicrobiales bacterium]|nr:glycoside hydrolase family 15 protein [Acidimicrobiales bacterium]